MSFDKVKAMRNAERCLSQGKIRPAIAEYKRIVENDAKDYSTLNILGDLHVKNGEQEEAVACYSRVAEHFSRQGFAQKAIAIYNKIARILPDSLDVSLKLAKLYQMKGSFAEARTHYVALAEQYQKKGQKSEALEIWKQIGELDPYNTEVYLKIAETCVHDGNKDEAVRSYAEAGLRLSKQNNLDAALNAYTRALEIRPFDLNALNGYVSIQIKLGNTDDAATHLEAILEKNPYNREILYLLVDCYIAAARAEDAERAVVKLVEQEPANYPKFLDLVGLYVRTGDLVAAVRIMTMSSEHLLVGGKSDEFLNWTNEILLRDPEQLEGIRLLVRYHSWQRDETELRHALQRLAEVANLKGAADEERYALGQLVMIMPHEINYAQRLQELGSGGAAPSQFQPESSFEFAGNTQDVPSFDNYQDLATEPAPELNGFEFAYTGPVSEEAAPDAFVYTDPIRQEYGEVIPSETTAAEASPISSVMSPLPLTASDELRIEQEIDSIRFYVSQEYFELAGKTIEGLESQFGSRPEFEALKAEISEKSGGTIEFAAISPVPAEITAAESGSADLVETSAPTVFEEFVEEASTTVDAINAESAHAELAEPISAENSFGFEMAPAETPAHEEDPHQSFDGDSQPATYAADSSEAFAADGSEEEMQSDAAHAIADTTVTADEIVALTHPESQKTFEFFDDFKNELGLEESEPAPEDDYETHYHLAIAYKEMGLMEESIREFQEAVNMVRCDDGTRRFFQCCNLLGLCFMEQGMPNLALIWYRRALETPGLSDEEKQALLYETAIAYEMGGEMPKAVEAYEQIYAVNVDYRDVSMRLEHLRESHFTM